MQPTLALTASHPGIIYINGCFAGEVSAESPLLRPVNSQGPLYLDFRPLNDACFSLTRKLVFSGGEPMAESIDTTSGLNVLIWPGGTVEIELSPLLKSPPSSCIHAAGHVFRMDYSPPQLYCDDRLICSLPDGASMPEYRQIPNGTAFTGSCADGRYLLTFDESFLHQTGYLQARQLNFEPDGRIQAIVSAGDLVGHAAIETWKLTPEGLMMLSSESAWINGSPRWPASPAETARAAVEAALAGLNSEAEGYLSPALRNRISLSDLCNACDLCVEMKYAPPDARPCTGLMQLDGEHLARVRPLYYRASPSGGMQGPWMLEELDFSRAGF